MTIKRLLAGTPYYVAARELEVKVHSLEVAAELQKRQGMLTNLRDAFFTRMSARHNKAILWAVSCCLTGGSRQCLAATASLHVVDVQADVVQVLTCRRLHVLRLTRRFSNCGSSRPRSRARDARRP